VFKAYVSTDAFKWNPFGQAVISMGADVYVGIAVTSHDATQPAQAHFDDVTLRRGAFQPTPTPPDQD
jgi:hypothetical protein